MAGFGTPGIEGDQLHHDRDIPPHALLRGLERDALPASTQVIRSSGCGADDRPRSEEGDQSGHAEFGRFLDRPFHVVAVDDGESQGEAGTGPHRRSRFGEDVTREAIAGCGGDADLVTGPSRFSQPDRLAGPDTEAALQMTGQRPGDRNGPLSDGVPLDEEDGHPLFEHVFHFVEDAAFMAERLAAAPGVFLQQFLLLRSQLRGDFDFHADELIARAIAPQAGRAEPLEPEDLVMLRPGRDVDDRAVAFQRRHLDLRAERGGGETDGELADDVVALASEGRMRGHLDQHIEVAGGAAVLPRLALVRQAQPSARLDAGRNVQVERAFRLHPLMAAARRTERGDRVAGALAASARLDVFGTLGPAAAALLADLPQGDLETDFLAVDGVFKREVQAILDVGAARDPAPPWPSAEEVLEDVVENIAEALPEPFKALRTLGMAEGVVATALVLVTQRGVGFVDLFEFLLGGLLLLLAGLGVGMVLPCEPSVGLLNLLLAGVPVDAEDLVVVSFHHRGDGSSWRHTIMTCLCSLRCIRRPPPFPRPARRPRCRYGRRCWTRRLPTRLRRSTRSFCTSPRRSSARP